MRTSRRQLLKSTFVAGSAGLGLAVAGPALSSRIPDPFTLGVASGDPLADGFVLWTRLARHPLAPDGRGGMPRRDEPVRWQVARDPWFHRVVAQGTAVARAAEGHSVHVEVSGLRPDEEYWYRFRHDAHLSPVGRARTAPSYTSTVAGLELAVASCANFEHGWFTAYGAIADQEPDLVLFLGDYIYELDNVTWPAPTSGNVRRHVGGEADTLAEYRVRYAQYKTDPDLQRAHAAAPWCVIPDDHEVDDNWAGDHAQSVDAPQPHFRARRTAALQAYYENMPLRRANAPHLEAGPSLHRRISWGRLATVHLLDTRQYRDDQACVEMEAVDCADATGDERSILGAEQEAWLRAGLRSSASQWDLMAQQSPVVAVDHDPGPGEAFMMDQWDGYTAARDRLLQSIRSSEVRNPVVLSGDVHRHMVADLQLDGEVVAGELVTTSITSRGDGYPTPPLDKDYARWCPDIRCVVDRRGYLGLSVTGESLTARLHTLERVTRKHEPLRTPFTATLADQQRGFTVAGC